MTAIEYPITIVFVDDRKHIETKVIASNLQTAIFVALDEAHLEVNDFVDMIHVGRPTVAVIP